MHSLRSTLVLTIWVLLSIVSATSIFHAQFKEASTQLNFESSARLSIGNDLEQDTQTPIDQVGSLNKRRAGQDLLLMSFEPEELLIPIQAAAEFLEAFYTYIAVNALGDWSKLTPRIWIRISFGTIRLLMTSTEGTTIPWNFVSYFAAEMLRLAERGYTGMYTAGFVSPTMGNAIWVSLYLCTIGPLTDPAALSTPAKAVSCLNPNAPSWFPGRGPPSL